MKQLKVHQASSLSSRKQGLKPLATPQWSRACGNACGTI